MKLKRKAIYTLFISSLILSVMSCKLKSETDELKPELQNILTPGGFEPDNFDIYLLIGQSNMAGRAEITAEVSDTLEDVYLFTGTKWGKAANPINMYSTVRKRVGLQKLGPGYTFARKIAQSTDHGIGLISNARGGTRIEWWQKGYSVSNDFDLYEDALARAKAARKDGNLKGIIWHQGESNQSSSSGYLAELDQLVTDLREDLDMSELYFVAGQLGKWRSSSEDINNRIQNIPLVIDNADYVVSDGLTPLNGDSTNPHFDSRSQQILGQRYADKVLEELYQ